jgi:sugar phosphate isomerase/epimerase
MKIACQTITWGNTISEKLPEIFREVSGAGYGGVEVGYRHLSGHEAGWVRGELEAAGLALVGIHVGGILEDRGQAEHEQGMIGEVLDFAGETGTRLVMYSGLKEVDRLEQDIAVLNRAAVVCAERGVRLLFHNHNWEFANGQTVMKALLGGAVPELGLCPDVGWAAYAGVDLPVWLGEVKARLGAIHFKDFGRLGDGLEIVGLGNGKVPLAEVAAWVRKEVPDLWVIAEQDTAEIEPAEAARRNAAFLGRVLS